MRPLPAQAMLLRGKGRNPGRNQPLALARPISRLLLWSAEFDPGKELACEVELLRRVGHGDRQSFEQLYDRFSKVLFSIAYRILNNQDSAEDVLQDVFVQIWRKAPLFDPSRGKPMTWAVTLTRNRAIDLLRATQRRAGLQDTLQREQEEPKHSRESSPVEAVTADEIGELVHTAMRKLSKRSARGP